MDMIRAVQLYLDKIIDESGPGMKVLLMDKETVRFIFPLNPSVDLGPDYFFRKLIARKNHLFEKTNCSTNNFSKWSFVQKSHVLFILLTFFISHKAACVQETKRALLDSKQEIIFVF